MSNRTMLKEAIADAKTIKETAIANAKAALEESFTPHIKDMLSAKLQEMDKEDDLDEGKKEDSKDKVEEMDAPSYKYKSGESLDPIPAKVGQSTIQEEETELDEMLAELEEEIEEGKMKKDHDSEDMKESKEEVTEEVTEEVSEDLKEEDTVKEAEEDEEEEIDVEDEEIDLEDMSEDDLKGYIEDVIQDMVDDGELEPGDEFESEEGEEDMEAGDMEMGADADVEMDADIELDEMKGKDKKEDSMDEAYKKKEDDKMEEAKKKEDDEVKEALGEIEKLRAELNEVNLLNAKLLYTNKLFRAKNLSEAQKVKVLESFDKATTVKETKLVFDTLSEGIKSAPKKSINEVKGSASKAVGTINETVKQPIVESNDMVARFQKLAGIIN